MRAFNCDHCGHLVFFDSTHCVHCRSVLASAAIGRLTLVAGPKSIAVAGDRPAGGDAVFSKLCQVRGEE